MGKGKGGMWNSNSASRSQGIMSNTRMGASGVGAPLTGAILKEAYRKSAAGPEIPTDSRIVCAQRRENRL